MEKINTTEHRFRHIATSRDAEGRLQPTDGTTIEELGRAIEQDEQLVIFRGAFTQQEMVELRRDILAWGEEHGAWPQGVPASKESINFHRVDDGKISGRMAHIFHQFGIGAPDELTEPLKGKVAKLRAETFDLQNRLAGTDFDLDAPEFRTKAIRHPRGGGYLVPHAHPYLPQKIAIFLNASEPGEDYHSGGARFRRSDGEWINTHDDFRSGDLLAWRYSMVHETSPIDSDAGVNWDNDDGFWIMAIEYVAAHEGSEVAESD
jgi:hypothetical protein